MSLRLTVTSSSVGAAIAPTTLFSPNHWHRHTPTLTLHSESVGLDDLPSLCSIIGPLHHIQDFEKIFPSPLDRMGRACAFLVRAETASSPVARLLGGWSCTDQCTPTRTTPGLWMACRRAQRGILHRVHTLCQCGLEAAPLCCRTDAVPYCSVNKVMDEERHFRHRGAARVPERGAGGTVVLRSETRSIQIIVKNDAVANIKAAENNNSNFNLVVTRGPGPCAHRPCRGCLTLPPPSPPASLQPPHKLRTRTARFAGCALGGTRYGYGRGRRCRRQQQRCACPCKVVGPVPGA